MDLLHKEITEKIIKCYYKVYNTRIWIFGENLRECICSGVAAKWIGRQMPIFNKSIL